jgi:hypothetical protein
MIRVAYRYLGLRWGTFYLLRFALLRFLRWHSKVGVR